MPCFARYGLQRKEAPKKGRCDQDKTTKDPNLSAQLLENINM